MSEILVNEIKHRNGTSAMTINSDGTINRSVLPAWRVSLVNDMTGLGSNTLYAITFDDISNTTRNLFIQGGCTISSGVVTVPVSGIYQINANIRVDDISSGYANMKIEINSSSTSNTTTYSIEGTPSGSYQTISAHSIFKLDANDTVRITMYSSSDGSWQVQDYSSFSGALIG